ncbi:uncharacterized protein LOC130553045 [Triplophysa rosa]|uniref:uncharacterized protein LOC130553045 n=1 Tax=Triplophysa rosa TaxID=992332 RepID=UPI00254610EE|nr:uncharacterized protein LOC130553045 [Triplophysa rosa]
MNPKESDPSEHVSPTGSESPRRLSLDTHSLSSTGLSPSLSPSSPSRLLPVPISTSPSRLSPTSHFVSSYSPVRLSPCPTPDLSPSPNRLSRCHQPLSSSVVFKKPIHIPSFSQTGKTLEHQKQIHTSPPCIIKTVDTCLNVPHPNSDETISHMEPTINKSSTASVYENEPLHSLDMHDKQWSESKIPQFKPISSPERRARSIPITNTRNHNKQTGQKPDQLFRPQHQDALNNLTSNVTGVTKPTKFDSSIPHVLKHVEKRRPQTSASFQKKRPDPTLVRIRLGLIKTGRIVNASAQISHLEEKPKIQRPSTVERLPLPVYSKMRSNLMCQNGVKHQIQKKKLPRASTEAKSQPSKQLKPTNSTTNQDSLVIASTSSTRKNSCQSSSNDNLTSKSKITGLQSDTSITSSCFTSGQCGRISCFQFPLKIHRSSTECSQMSRICRPVIKRTSEASYSRPTYLKSPQAWRKVSSAANQTTGGNERELSNSSQNRCNLTDSDSSKSSSSEATLKDDYRCSRIHRGSRLHKKRVVGCRIKYVGEEKRQAAVQPDPPELLGTSTEVPNTHTDSEMKEWISQNPKFLCNTDSIKSKVSEQTLQQHNAADCERFPGIHSVPLREQEDHPSLPPSVVVEMRRGSEVETCPGECVSAGESKNK